MTEFFAQPDDLGYGLASDLSVSLGERLGAQAAQAFGSGTRTLGRLFEYSAAEGIAPFTSEAAANDPEVAEYLREQQAAIPELSLADAKTRLKQEGLEGHVKLPAQEKIRAPVLDLMIAHGHEKRQHEAALSRGPQGFFPDALGFITEMGAGMLDPVNAAAFMIPVVGEARYGMMMASAGESLLARAGVRAGVGLGQGAVGGAALVPGEWWLHTLDGQDYTYADALRSVVLSAGMGAAFHSGFGAIGDVRARLKGRPLVEGTHVPARALAEEGVPAEEMPGIGPALGAERVPPEGTAPSAGPLPPHPAEVLADLPPRAQEDVVRAAAADMIAGRPVRAAEMLQEAGREDPRIAESLSLGHGERSYSAVEWLAHRGGLADNGELRTIFGGRNPLVPGFGRLIRKGGMGPDEALQALKDGKYLIDAAEIEGGEQTVGHREMYELLDREARGEKQLPMGSRSAEGAADHGEYVHRLESDLDFALRDAEVDPSSVHPKLRARAIEIMDKERADPLDAYERAWGEEVQRTTGGGYVPPKPEAARADFSRFAERPEPEPDLVEASRAAEHAPEPESVAAPEKALSAAEKAAAEADKLLADIRPRLSEEEARLFDEALENVARDAKERSEITRQAAACLLEAVA